MDQNFPRIGVGVFIWKNGKFLMGQRVGVHGTGTWSVPGGYLEFGESWEDCAKREVIEEVNIEITNVRFLALTNNLFPEENKHTLTIWLNSDWVQNEPHINEPDKFISHEWRTFDTLPSPLFSPWEQLKIVNPELFSTL